MNYTLETPFGNPHGRLSKRNCKIIWMQNNATGRHFTQVRYRSSRNAPTASQVATMTKFRQAAQQTNTIMMDIEQLAAYRNQWRIHLQSGNVRYKTLRGFVFAHVYSTL